jgi:hypothetical protein
MFENFFYKFSFRKTDISKLAPEQRKIYRVSTNNPIQIKPFSDAIIVSVSLNTKATKLPTRGIFGIFTAAASTALVSLATGHPIRGGIDIGLGMEIHKGEIYGPSLSRAYSLESKVAGYPRIVVGKECIDYLQSTANIKPKDIFDEIGAAIAKDCLKLLKIDVDGCAIIDFLGEYFFQVVKYKIDQTIVNKALTNVIMYSERYKKENNTKLAFRYTLLRRYMEYSLNRQFLNNVKTTQPSTSPESQGGAAVQK